MRGVMALICLGQAFGAPPVTFSRDIAPILYKRCVVCHRSGEVGPFPLVSYADASKRAALIAQVTASRYMPPWKPEPGYGDFDGARALTRAEIDTLRRWVEAGAPQGDSAKLPPLPASGSAKITRPD